MAGTSSVKFKTVLTKANADFGWHFLLVERKHADKLKFEKGSKRVLCTVNGELTFPCALMPWGETFYIIVSKDKRERLGIELGDKVQVELVRDDSKYGLPMPEELREVLNQDADGDRHFHALTPGKQRSILYWVTKVKDVDKRIHMSLIFIEHLKKNEGKIIHDLLQKELKRPMF